MMNRLLVFFALIAGIASAQSHIRTFELVTDNTTFPTPANVSWMQGESPKFSITAKYGNYYVAFSNGAAPVLKMWSGSVVTQLYAIKTGSVYNASSGKLTVELAANEANIQPAGEYNYAVGVYDGTNYMGVVAQGKATVKAHPFGASVGYVGTSSLFNFVPTNEAPVTNAYIVGSSGTGNVAKVGRRLAITFPAGGGGSGTFTNLVWNGNANTAQAIVLGESNVVLRYAGGTSYVGLASSITGDMTFNGAINANDHIEIANTKHLRFQDGGGTNTVHLEAVKGRLIITGAVDIVTGQAVHATINGSAIATASDVSARLASNVWAAADSTTNYVRRTGGSYTATGGWEFIAGGLSNNLRLKAGDSLGQGGDLILAAGDADSGGDIKIYSGLGDSGPGDIILGIHDDTNPFLILSNTNGATFYLPVSGDGSGLTGLNGASITNLSAFSTIRTNGSGNVVTNLTFGGSVITQQMGTVTGGGSTTNLAVVEPHWFRTQAGATSIWSYADLGSGDMLTVATATNIESYPLIFQTAQAGSLQQLTREGSFVSPIDATNIIVDLKSNATNGSAVVSIFSGTASGIRTQSLVGAAGTIYSLNVPILLKAWQRIGVSVSASLQNTNAATAVGQLGAGYWRAQN